MNVQMKEAMKRWEKMYDELNARITRQSAGIDRLLKANQAMAAALFEIAEGDLDPASQRTRARRALADAEAASGNEPEQAK